MNIIIIGTYDMTQLSLLAYYRRLRFSARSLFTVWKQHGTNGQHSATRWHASEWSRQSCRRKRSWSSTIEWQKRSERSLDHAKPPPPLPPLGQHTITPARYLSSPSPGSPISTTAGVLVISGPGVLNSNTPPPPAIQPQPSPQYSSNRRGGRNRRGRGRRRFRPYGSVSPSSSTACV